jgi:phenylpropionate dioxygenase-like ring-hydroxylating dioxygenase large terminal subunit
MPSQRKDGSAYHLPAPQYDAGLTRVERATPMGELLRRYWHPVGLASDATGRPKPVRVLGEDLILFRDGDGRAGLLYPRCCHRGTTLYYGKVEQRGIHCCYHGWLFDAEGHCLDMPVEPGNGASFKHKVRQPWYPVEERYGLIFAYLGPPEHKPLLPRFQVLEELADGEFVEADDQGIGTGGGSVAPCNWLQHFENVMDPLHVPILHDGFSGAQFVGAMGIVPDVRLETFALGVRS